MQRDGFAANDRSGLEKLKQIRDDEEAKLIKARERSQRKEMIEKMALEQYNAESLQKKRELESMEWKSHIRSLVGWTFLWTCLALFSIQGVWWITNECLQEDDHKIYQYLKYQNRYFEMSYTKGEQDYVKTKEITSVEYGKRSKYGVSNR
jgi:hypothetical protein